MVGSGECLIQWKGIDETTRTTYVPTWERKTRKTGCTPELIVEWMRKKTLDSTIVDKTNLPLRVSHTPSSSTSLPPPVA